MASKRKAFMTISDIAARRVKEMMKIKNDASLFGIKIGVKQRGCNGLSYTMNYCDKNIGKFDEIVEDKGVRLVIDSKALMVLVGTEMDLVEDELRSEFVFKNPNAKGTCGCGESFHV